MNDDRLRLDLTDLADEVTPVDLRDRALRTSRRLGIQRAIATSAAAVVMLGAATGTAFALMPRADGPAPTPAGPTETVTPPPAEVTPTPTPSTTPSTIPSTREDMPAAATIGRLFYVMAPSNVDLETSRLWSYQLGKAPVRLLELPHPAEILNASVSPDGERVAWIAQDLYLRVAEVDGSNERKVSAGEHALFAGDCWHPTWSGDSRRLLVNPLVKAEPNVVTEKGVIDLGSGRYSRSADIQGCHPLLSADGKVLAYADGEGKVMVGRPDGSGRRSIPNLSGDGRYSAFDLASLSPDGSRIALLRQGRDEAHGDVARDLWANVVLDTRTGEVVDLPLDGRRLRQAYFQADGSLVARVVDGDGLALLLISSDGRKISETAEPAQFKGMQILSVTS